MYKLIKIYKTGGIKHVVRKILLKSIRSVKNFADFLLFTKLEMFIMLGYWPNLRNPRSFNEKLNYRKIYAPHPLSNIVADKWAVREYILKKTNDKSLLNEVYFVTDNPEKIPFDKLPNKFVIKATHGSGWNIIVRNKKKANFNKIINQCNLWLNSKYSVFSGNIWERHYDNIKPQILVEKFIEDPNYDVPLDYKFFCFYGKPVFIQVDINRFNEHKRNLYSISWKKIPAMLLYKNGKDINRPLLFEKMLYYAKKISEDFDFCRVDFYNPDKKRVIFGEITLVPGSGMEYFYPKDWDFIFGKIWDLGRDGITDDIVLNIHKMDYIKRKLGLYQ